MEEKTPLQKVVDLFIDYYGEDRIDLQNNDIIIYYPSVIITNEHNKSHEIKELYTKVKVHNNGSLNGTFSFVRAEFTLEEWNSDYLHSHVSGINKSLPSNFKSSCLGSGPIRNTCLSLNDSFDEDIWKLFIFELDRYIQTESLEGGPYRRLENIGISRSTGYRDNTILIPQTCVNMPIEESLFNNLLGGFLDYVIQRRLFTFNFINGKYDIADSPYNIVIKLSNLFIDWYNNLPASQQGNIKTDLINNDVLIRCKVGYGVIKQRIQSIRDDFTRSIGKRVLTFKGKQISLNITSTFNNTVTLNDENLSWLLKPNVVMYFMYRLLRVVNYRYGTKERIETGEEVFYV